MEGKIRAFRFSTYMMEHANECRRAGRTGSKPDSALVKASIVKGHLRGETQMYQLKISLHKRIVEQCGFAGHALDLGIDGQAACLMRCDSNEDGRHLQEHHNGKGGDTRPSVAFTLYGEMDCWRRIIPARPCTNVEQADGMLAFNLPF